MLKGVLFRALVSYEIIHQRNTVTITDKVFIEKIENETRGIEDFTLAQIAAIGSKLTTDHLSFTFENQSQDLSKVLKSRKANCVGYARLFNSICEYIISSNHLEEQFSTNHIVAKIYFFNYELTQLFDAAFFKDHDFVQIVDLDKEKHLFFDPSLKDYIGVGEVRLVN